MKYREEDWKMKVLVTGATGHVGSELVKQLSQRNARVRVLVRKATGAFPAGVEVAVGDLLDPISVRNAMEGADKLYLLNAVTPDELTQGLIAYDDQPRVAEGARWQSRHAKRGGRMIVSLHSRALTALQRSKQEAVRGKTAY